MNLRTSRLSRRRLLASGGAILAAGGVAFAAGRTAGRDDEPGSPAPRTTSAGSPTRRTATPMVPTTAPGSRPSPAGEYRPVARRAFAFDTFDALRAGDPSVLEVLARSHARLLRWREPDERVLAPDLAGHWEQPDALTVVLTLDGGARWQDRRPAGGRSVTAGDVVAHFERLLALNAAEERPALQRAQDVSAIDRVAALDDRQVRIDLVRPDVLVLPALASRMALVQAPESVEAFSGTWGEADPEQVVGAGPWVLEGWTGGGALRFRAHDGHLSPRAAGLVVQPASIPAEALLGHEVDEFIARDRRDGLALREAVPSLRETPTFAPEAVISSFSVDGPPWNDPELRRAISTALNRGFLADALFAGRAEAAAPLAPVFGSFALPEVELGGVPGYRADATADAADARARWAAAGGETLGEVVVDIPSIFDPRYSASSVVTSRLNEVLSGDQFRPAVETYTTISRRAAEGAYGNGRAAFWFGWAPGFAEPEPGPWLAETYRSGSPGAAATGFSDVETDRLLDALQAEPDAAARQQLVHDLQWRLLDVGGGGVLDWVVQRFEHFSSPYVTGQTISSWPVEHLDDVVEVDVASPRYPGR